MPVFPNLGYMSTQGYLPRPLGIQILKKGLNNGGKGRKCPRIPCRAHKVWRKAASWLQKPYQLLVFGHQLSHTDVWLKTRTGKKKKKLKCHVARYHHKFLRTQHCRTNTQPRSGTFQNDPVPQMDRVYCSAMELSLCAFDCPQTLPEPATSRFRHLNRFCAQISEQMGLAVALLRGNQQCREEALYCNRSIHTGQGFFRHNVFQFGDCCFKWLQEGWSEIPQNLKHQPILHLFRSHTATNEVSSQCEDYSQRPETCTYIVRHKYM